MMLRKIVIDGNVCASGQPETENMQEEGIREFCAADLSDLLLKTREAVYESAEITKEQIVPYDKPAEDGFSDDKEELWRVAAETVVFPWKEMQMYVISFFRFRLSSLIFRIR